jgi:ADP-heptose:LPS heptosyltransferase
MKSCDSARAGGCAALESPMGIMQAPHPEAYRLAQRILLCLHWGIGDTVMERPLLSALRRAAPHARLAVLGSQRALEVLEGGTLIDEATSYESLGIVHFGQPATPQLDDSIREWVERTGPYDDIFDCRHAPPAVQHAFWWGSIRTIESDEHREQQALASGAGCQRAWIEAAAAGWNIPMDPQATPRLDPPGWARRAAEHFLETHGLSDRLPAALSPVASLGLKRWPAERFAEIGDRLIESTRSPLLVFAGDDAATSAAILSQMERRDLAIGVGQRHLLETAAILQRCRALLCNDTGLLHIAAAVGTPVVGIYGPTSPELYRPRFPWALALGGREPPCPHRASERLTPAGCWGPDRCLIDEGSCIKRVGVEDVWDALRTLIPLTTAPAAMHPSHQAIAGAGKARADRKETEARSGGR